MSVPKPNYEDETRMTTYRFINADHSLVVTPDGHVIAWDPQANQPRQGPPPGPQPAPTAIRRPPNEVAEPLDTRDHAARASLLTGPPSDEPMDEMKAWRDAGSPQPTDLDAALGRTAPFLDQLPPLENTMTMAPPVVSQQAAPAVQTTALDQIDEAIANVKGGRIPKGASDVAALCDQLAALTKVVRELVAGRQPQPMRPKP